MAELIQNDGMQAILKSLPVRSDIHPLRQLEALRALRDRMHEHIDPDAMNLLGSAIAELEKALKKDGVV